MAKAGLSYLFISLFLALFGAVYELFSHEVYSYYMIYAFAIPLAAGALPCLLLAFYAKRLPGQSSMQLYHSGIAALTVGCVVQGVLSIYGTSNRLVAVYWIAGALFVGAAVVGCCLGSRRKDGG